MCDEYLQETKSLLDWADQNYPNSVIFSWSKQRFLRSSGLYAEAIKEAQTAVDNCEELPTLKLFSYFQQGWCSFILLRFDDAGKYFASMLEESTAGAKNSVQASYCYQAGLSYSIKAWFDKKHKKDYKHHDKKAIELLTNTPNFVNVDREMRDIEKYSVRRSKCRLNGEGHPVLDGLELMCLFACFDLCPIEPASACLKLLDEACKEKASWNKVELCRSHVIRACILKSLLKTNGSTYIFMYYYF